MAEDDSRVVGFSSVWLQDNFIHHLFVDPTQQGRGIGKMLLEACLNGKLCKPARLKCVVRNQQACEFYERLGWRVESTTEDGPMGPYHSYLFRFEQ